MSTGRLANKVAIITGAASGIGEAAARLFAAHGATVVIADVQDELGRSVAASIGCTYRHCDVSDEKQVEETVEHTVETYGRVDIMYSNAGILGRVGPGSGVLDMDLDSLDKVLAVNVRGAAAAIKHAARAMVAKGTRGSILCTASMSAHVAGQGPAAYTASKRAVVGLVQAAAGQLGKHGVRVNSVSPAGVATPMTYGVLRCSKEEMEGMIVATANLKGVVLKAEHVAEAALFLASDEAEFVSGHDLVVDGGFSVFRPAK